MTKAKNPRRPKKAAPEPQTEPQAQLVPAAEPVRVLSRSAVRQVAQRLRDAVETLLDLADAAAETIRSAVR